MSLILMINKFWLNKHHWSGCNGCWGGCRWKRWWWNGRNHIIENWTVWWTEWVCKDTRGTRLLLIVTSIAHSIWRLILCMSHGRWQRTNWWVLTIRSSRHTHRLHALLLLLCQACLISGDVFVMGQRFLRRVNKMASAKWEN